ncbi:hypothetical protein GGH92_007234, partial [Coemansia sp. RSA 2673]
VPEALLAASLPRLPRPVRFHTWAKWVLRCTIQILTRPWVWEAMFTSCITTTTTTLSRASSNSNSSNNRASNNRVSTSTSRVSTAVKHRTNPASNRFEQHWLAATT